MNPLSVIYYAIRYQLMSREKQQWAEGGLAAHRAITEAYDSYSPSFRSLLIQEALGVKKDSAESLAHFDWAQFKPEGQLRLVPIVKRVMEGVPYTGESADDLALAAEAYDYYGEDGLHVAWTTLPTYVKRRLLQEHFQLHGYEKERVADMAWSYLPPEMQDRLAPVIRDMFGK